MKSNLSDIIQEKLETEDEIRIRGSLEDYFDLLEVYQDSEYDLEFDNGEIIAKMSYATKDHELIVANIIRILGNLLLDDDNARVYGSGRLIYVPACKKSYIPDAVIAFGEEELFPRKRQMPALLNPSIIVEVQSNSTKDLDFSRKLSCYKQIPSISQIVYVNQYVPLVSVYSPTETPKEWRVIDYISLEENAKIANFDVPMQQIYRKIIFAEGAI